MLNSERATSCQKVKLNNILHLNVVFATVISPVHGIGKKRWFYKTKVVVCCVCS